ncbi:extracellular calcium-sensing receptor-like [Gastrophryne carolinensis]
MLPLAVTLWILILLSLFPMFHCDERRCRLDIRQLEGITQPGDIVIGATLPLHFGKVYRPIVFKEKPPETSCTMFHLESFQQVQALMFAVEEINNNPVILPNITLGFDIFNSCNVLQYDLQAVLQLITGLGKANPNFRCFMDAPLSGIIGSASSTHSILLAHILGIYRYPQVSHFSTSQLLSDRSKFASFFRTVPSNTYQSQGIVQLLLHFEWTFVGLVAVDNDYGHQGIQLVRQEIIKAGACVAFTEYILISKLNRNAPRIVEAIKKTAVNAVVVFATEPDLFPIFEEMIKQNVTGKIFVASEGWSTSTSYLKNTFSKLLSGTTGLALYSEIIPGFGDFLKKVHPSNSLGQGWVRLFWEETFNCRFGIKTIQDFISSSEIECNGTESLEDIQNAYTDVSTLRITNKVYMAVHVFAKALEDLRSFRTNNGGDMKNWHFKPWQLLHTMKSVKVRLNNGRELYFDKNGDPPAVYDIVNWQMTQEGTIQIAKVGSYDTISSGQVFNINSSALIWNAEDNKITTMFIFPMNVAIKLSFALQVPRSVCSESCPPGYRKAAITGQPVCCHKCISCPLGEISESTDALNCFKCPWDQWPNPQKNKCLHKALEYLSYEDPLGVTLSLCNVLSSLVPVLILRLFVRNKSSPIVKANNYSLSCLLLVSLSMCFLCSLNFIGYPNPEQCLIRQAAFGLVSSICMSCILAKTIMVVFAFMATKPSSGLKKWAKLEASYLIVVICFSVQLIFCISWLSVSPPFPQYDVLSQPVLVIECNEGSSVAFWTMLGYLFLLAAISFTVAFQARKLPDSFNEAKFITFSMLAFLSVWISYIPASLSAQGKCTVAMEVFAILASTWAIVVCMFLPKCFIIIFKPNKNSKAYVIRAQFNRNV